MRCWPVGACVLVNRIYNQPAILNSVTSTASSRARLIDLGTKIILSVGGTALRTVRKLVIDR
jgi:3-keto-L-gulonate-6-phosphate decarboxylase